MESFFHMENWQKFENPISDNFLRRRQMRRQMGWTRKTETEKQPTCRISRPFVLLFQDLCFLSAVSPVTRGTALKLGLSNVYTQALRASPTWLPLQSLWASLTLTTAQDAMSVTWRILHPAYGPGPQVSPLGPSVPVLVMLQCRCPAP